MGNNNFLNQGFEPYLSEKAKRQLDYLSSQGIDRDLAFEMVTSSMGETDAYELPHKKDINGVTTWTK